MPACFCLTVRFLQPLCHGRSDGGEPEWPPSPLRAFQALAAAAAAHWNERERLAHAAPALRWLEQQPPPAVLAVVGTPSKTKYRLYVPDNVGDMVAGSWTRGGDASIAEYRTEKSVCATNLVHGGNAVHYLWSLSGPACTTAVSAVNHGQDARDTEPLPDFKKHMDVLTAAARSITHLGWGIDMVAADASLVSENEAALLSGERWSPGEVNTGGGLRVPKRGTLDALIQRHERFLKRMETNRDGSTSFTAPPPLSVFDTVAYRRETDIPQRPFAAFSLLKPDTSGFRPFDTVRQGLTVAGMLRHAAEVAARNTGQPGIVDTIVLGHGEPKGAKHVPVGKERFAYLPLPSIEPRGNGKARVVGSIRRVLVTSFAQDFGERISWVRRALSGQELVDQDGKKAVALLSTIPTSDKVVRNFVEPAACWATVTPVVLPGYDDPKHYRRRLKAGVSAEEQKRLLDALSARIDGLLRKSIAQAGFSEALAQHAELDWRKSGFWPGTELADRYGVPAHLKRFPRYHVRVRWRDAGGNTVGVPGPICVGGGRYYGLGLFARMEE